MEGRQTNQPAAPRSRYEKVRHGGLLLVALIGLIVGPIAFFSTLNPSLKKNFVNSAHLSVDMVVTTRGMGVKSATLYEAGQKSIDELDQHDYAKRQLDYSQVGAQVVRFPDISDTFWLISGSLQHQLVDMLGLPDTGVRLDVSTMFYCERMPGAVARGSTSTPLTADQIATFQQMINATSSSFGGHLLSMSIPNAVRQLVRIDSNMQTAQEGNGEGRRVVLTLHHDPGPQGDVSLPYWSLAQAGSQCGASQSCALEYLVVTEKVAPTPIRSTDDQNVLGDSSSWSVIGIYFGVVYTIGKFLRMSYQDSSKRMIYEELPDTALLLDLCNGIYIARIQGLLQTEYTLYQQLVEIYRSPELLINVCRSGDAVVQPNAAGSKDFGGGQQSRKPSLAQDRSGGAARLPPWPALAPLGGSTEAVVHAL